MKYVKIGSSYYLFDPTWGSRSCDGVIYSKNFREFYFCTNPEAFTYLSEEQQWQLINPTINLKTFVIMLKINDAFYEYGFTIISLMLQLLVLLVDSR